MVNECTYLLPNGKKCRCVATRGHAFCRHHGTHPVPARKARTESRKERWRMMSLQIHELPFEQLSPAIDRVMTALCCDGYHGISDRTAGALLRAILYRFEQLAPKPQPATIAKEDMPFPEMVAAITREQGLDEKTIQKLMKQLEQSGAQTGFGLTAS